MMADDQSLPVSATQWFRAAALGFALLAFCLQPVLRFVDADRLMGGGAMVAASLTGFVAAYNEKKLWGVIVWGSSAVALLLLGGWLLATSTTRAGSNAVANDRRCLAIQSDMLSSHPRRSDGPDLFQALGCRPQGEGSVYAPPPKTRQH